jgi:hypothetical protein
MRPFSEVIMVSQGVVVIDDAVVIQAPGVGALPTSSTPSRGVNEA